MVVYYVLALTLFFDEAYEEVLQKLVNGLRFLRSWPADWTAPSTGAISMARTRLGEEPLKELFHRVAVPMARPGTRGSWYYEYRLMAMDSVVLDAPDTPENVSEFGKKGHRDGGESVYPQVRVMGLAECGTRAMLAAAVDSWQVYERDLARTLFGNLTPGMLLIADRGFYSYDLWKEAAATGSQLLWRLMKSIRLPVLEALPDGSYLSELLPKQLKTDLNRGMKRRVADGVRVPVRVVEYRITNRDGSEDVIRLVTTLLDHIEVPAEDLARLYQERWEFELGLDEIETHQMGAKSVLRSKTPELVKQEIWALLITHYAIRDFIREAADDLQLDPDRLSFIRGLRIIRRSVLNAPGDFSPSEE